MNMSLKTMSSTDASLQVRRARRMRLLGVFVLLLTVCGLMPTRSWATDICGTTPSPGYSQAPSVLTFTWGSTLSVNPNAPVGAVLASMSGSLASAGGGSVYCNFNWINTYYLPTGSYAMTTTVSGGALAPIGTVPVVPSAIPGVGIAIQFLYGTAMTSAHGYMPELQTVQYNGIANVNGGAYITIYLVKTGPVAGGSLAGEFAHWTIDPQDGSGYTFNWVSMRFSGSIPVQPTVPACIVSSANPISVTLPDQSAAGFSGVGTIAGQAQSFSIDLACSGGTAGTSTNMYVTLTDATNPGNTTDMLSPTTATANTGVGVRIFNGSTPVKYGPDSSTVGNTNQWKVATVSPGSSTVSIPLTATYVQVGSTVQSGPVSAIATFTMAYN